MLPACAIIPSRAITLLNNDLPFRLYLLQLLNSSS